MAQRMKGMRRYRAAYRVARALACPYFVRRFRYEAGPVPDIKGPFLLVVNHVTELDFMLVGASFKTPLAFVVGDTLLRAPVVGWLLKKLLGVIPKDKGMVDKVVSRADLPTTLGLILSMLMSGTAQTQKAA